MFTGLQYYSDVYTKYLSIISTRYILGLYGNIDLPTRMCRMVPKLYYYINNLMLLSVLHYHTQKCKLELKGLSHLGSEDDNV